MIRNKTVLLMALMVAVALTACSKGGGGGKANPASDFEVKNIDGDKAVEITNYIGVTQNVNIPSKIRELPVTHIGEGAFREKSLTSISIPNSVTTIGNEAFRENQLTNVTIPNSVTYIGERAFNQLTSITIGANVKLVDGWEGAFVDIDGQDIDPSGFDTVYNNGGKLAGTYIRNADAYRGWHTGSFEDFLFVGTKVIVITGYTGSGGAVTIPAAINGIPVTIIGDNAFRKKNLTSVTIPNSVTEIRGFAFCENKLTSVVIPNSVTTIGEDAFSDNQLTSVILPDSVAEIGDMAFIQRTSSITSITIGANVKLVYRWGGPFDDIDSQNHTVVSSGFGTVYNNGGKLAGTYTRPNTDSKNWTRQ